MRLFFSVVLLSAGVAAAAVERPSVQKEIAELKAKLAEKTEALQSAQQKLAAIAAEERWYEEASALGITKLVERSGLTEKAQRRVAVAIVREAHANGLDPLLVAAVIRSESSFDNYAVSGVGAMGLMQMMPDTGRFLAENRHTPYHGKNNLFDAELNIELGTAYLAQLISDFGSVPRALVAYNAGPGMAKRILASPKSRKKFMAGYPHTVMSAYRKLQREHERTVADHLAVGEPTLIAEQGHEAHSP
jgi:soluble lytic murein transglycosylase